MNAVYGQAPGWRALVVVVVLHGAVLAALASLRPAMDPVSEALPLMVSLLTPPAPRPEVTPQPLPPQPRVLPRSDPPPPPLLAAPEDSPAPMVVPPPPPEPLPAPVVPPPPAPKPMPAVAVPAPAPVVAHPPPVVPPRFDADYLDNPAPSYPSVSRRLGEEGRVLLRVHVTAEGGASQVEVRESSGYERLDRVARETVLRWRFVPARQGDKGVAAWVLVPISFSIRS